MKTLQELCLEQIVHAFDRHILAYSTSTNLKSSLEVLRRRFSLEILQKLMEEYHEIEKEYVDFLINKYLKTLDTDWLDNCSWDVIEKKFPEIGPGLETLNFGIGNDDDDHDCVHWENILCHLPNLKVVKLRSCNDDYLACISKFCPKIESISLDDVDNVTHRGYQYLCSNEEGLSPCPRLKEIKLRNPLSSPPNFEDITYLVKKLPSLEKFNSHRLGEVLYSMHKDNLHNLAKTTIYNLTDLDMRHLPDNSLLDDALKICLSVCPYLKKLLCCVSKHEHLHLLSKLTGLQHLSLNGHFLNNGNFLELDDFLKEKKSELISLHVRMLSFSVANLVLTCPCLSGLGLNNVTFLNSEDTVPMFCNLKSLTFKCMNLKGRVVTSRALTSILESSPNLECLIIEQCGVNSSDAKTAILKLCEYGKIRHVSFRLSMVQYQFLHDILLTCFSLKSLNLEETRMEEYICSYYYTRKHYYTRITELQAIAFTLPNKPKVIVHSTVGCCRKDYDEFSVFYDGILICSI